ncbi:MAG: ATP-dependent sacrificial sulfur transferase LarE [Lachnospiraceae bacterium]|nr:ATP-dependent sacrificial sulfur transferase LarE [Lachnospiraceae bacterium]
MNLSEFFTENPQAAIAFSGGVDSAYLLYAAIQCGAKVRAYYVRSAFQPQFELDDGIRLARELGSELRILEADVLASKTIAANPPDRCYHCKRILFETIAREAFRDGFTLLLDGTNASDDEGDRPGMRALRELAVRSPLRMCGLTKEEIRRLSREAGLFTWDKPAYACLATRIPSGEMITQEKLAATEAAESYLSGLGLTDFRVRRMGDMARLQIQAGQIGKVMEKRESIVRELKQYYTAVLLDLETRH